MAPLVNDLPRLVELIERRLRSVARYPDRGEDAEVETWNRRQRELEAIIRDLETSEGASFGSYGGADTMALAGVKTTCTAGPHGLLRNWQAAARRALKDGHGRAM